MNKKFKLEHLGPVAKDERGHTIEWKLPDGRQITIYHRKKGAKLGGHFHKGGDPSKDPEGFFLISGRIKLIIDLNGNKIEKILEAEANNYLIMYPGLCHWMTPLTDVIYIEYRVTHFNKDNPDTYPCETGD